MKVVLAYSGGLDTSVCLKWLREERSAEILAFIADVGQGEDLAAVEEKAKATGASAVRRVDLREEFVAKYVFPAIKAAAVYEGEYLLGTALARPVITKHLVGAARSLGAEAIAHGATGKGNDQVRFELGIAALEPEIQVIAPWREWEFTSREDLFRYAEERGIPLPLSREKPYSVDANLMHCSYEGGVLEDPWVEPPGGIFQMTASPEEAPDDPEAVEIGFVHGEPVSVNGKELAPGELLATLNRIAGRHGIGRIDIVENRFVGMKSRGIYETPGVTILHQAHRAVESITMDREAMRLRDSLSPRFAELVYNGFWFSPEMKALLALIDSTQQGITGTARLKLYKGGAWTTGRKSPGSLYDPEVASFDTFGSFNSKDSEGFIRMHALRLSMNRSLRWND